MASKQLISDFAPHITFPDFKPGWVWLAGAGPGEATLLTLQVIYALQEADVIIYDALVGPDILSFANPQADQIFAGKRGGKPSPKQQDITDQLIALAQKGKKVLRLKGGDPFIFGRGGEEALALVKASVPFRILPGITAGCAGPALAGIPLTHRHHNSAVSFVTGHDSSGAVPDKLNWQALSDGAPVLVFYMALKHIAHIVGQLRKAGRGAAEAVAVLSHATLPNQQILRSTLGQLENDLARTSLKAPCIFVVGSVVNLQAILAPELELVQPDTHLIPNVSADKS